MIVLALLSKNLDYVSETVAIGVPFTRHRAIKDPWFRC
jgi:hypothetical protein